MNIKTRLIQGIPPAPGLGTVERPMDNPNAQTKIDALVVKFFSAFDNRGGARPRLEQIVECFTEKATIVRRSSSGAEVYTAAEFATPRIELLNQGALRDFYEFETDSTTQIFNGIAVRTSRYSKSGTMEGKPYHGSGTKCFQLVDLATAWKISSLAWVDDDA